eukprot:gb/GEZJ01004039.1/.p1 GENE.gb/GEZJ01004039.1/~~gb/GEZJ01004039.1/.p1  ORF type:complete len:653 (-),score=85.90 gb/GEZJ01004039.1/:165-2123(-)
MTSLFVAYVFLSLLSFSIAQSSRKVFVHYLPWYDASGEQYPARTGWCYPYGGTYDCSDLSVIHYSNVPLIGEYTQFDVHVLEYHFLLIFVTGIDGIIVNINPANALQKQLALFIFDTLLSMKSAFPSFDLNIIVSYDDGGAVSDQSLITTYLQWVHSNIYNNPVYSPLIFRDDSNRPVLLFWSESDNAHYWTTAQSLFQGNVLVFVRNAVNFQYSDGNFEWVNLLNTGKPLSNTANWGQQYFEDMDWVMARQSENGVPANTVNLLKMGGVYPGFDDQNVPPFWNGGTNRYHLRNVDDGETMALTWKKQIDYTPNRLGGPDPVQNPWIQIATWNDWPEGSSIEPSAAGGYGYTALETNRQKIAEFKMLSPSFQSACLAVPFEIYNRRKSMSADSAGDAVAQLLSGNCMLESPTPSPSITSSQSPSPSITSSLSPSALLSASSSPSASASTTFAFSSSPSASHESSPSISSFSIASPSVAIGSSPNVSPSKSSMVVLSPSPSFSPSDFLNTFPTPSSSLRLSISNSPSPSPSSSPPTSFSVMPSSSTAQSSSPSPSVLVPPPSPSPKCPCVCTTSMFPFEPQEFVRTCRVRTIFSGDMASHHRLSDKDIVSLCENELLQCGRQFENMLQEGEVFEEVADAGNQVLQTFFSGAVF